MTVIEIGFMGVKPNHAVMDPTQPEGQMLKRAWNSVTAHASGPRWVFGGTEIDDASRLWAFFEFDSLEHHAEFAKTFGAEAVKDLPSILTHSEFQKHWVVKPELKPVLQAPVVEVTFVYFPSDTSDQRQTAILEQTQQFVDSNVATAMGVKAVSIGWSVESDVPLLGCSHEKHSLGRILALFVGWASVDTAKETWSAASRRKNFEKALRDDGAFELVTLYMGCREFAEESSKHAGM